MTPLEPGAGMGRVVALCGFPSSVSDRACVLPLGHPADSPDRFHRFSLAFLSLDDDEWGVVVDALIEHRAAAAQRWAANIESASDVRADICARLIQRITEAFR